MGTDNFINEFEAALRFNFSPELLRWMTQYGVVDGKKLSFKEEHELYYFDVAELDALNKKMEGKWPKSAKGKRPNIPSQIIKEIKQEAGFSCPVCNKNIGEVAHIDAVSETQCNHPKNLIFLCPNHHTEYDNTLIPSNITKEEVVILKNSLLIFQRAQWKIKGQTIDTLLGMLNEMRSLARVREKGIASITDAKFKDTLLNITKLANGRFEQKYTGSETIDQLDHEINDYIEKHSENICPLCNGHGCHSYYDYCPVCDGSGELEPEALNAIDLSIYDLVTCKLCNGRGSHLGNDCPACGGEGEMPRYRYDNCDWSMYDSVKCKLCDGRGSHLGNDCPACSGDGEMSRYRYDNCDWAMYDSVKCKLCNGRGSHLGNDCPACGGEGEVSRHDYSYIDWNRFDLIECSLCRGEGRYHANDCIPCGGEGKLQRYISDDYDWSQFRRR